MAPRTVDAILRDTLGNLQLQIIQLQAALEAAQREEQTADADVQREAPDRDRS